MTMTPRLHTQQDMRRRNLAAVLHAVADGGPSSRARVASRIGLTRAAVSTLVDELLAAQLLFERGPGRSGGVGRPGTVLALSEKGPCGIGAEIGVDHLAVCAMDLRGRVRTRLAVDSVNRDSAPAPVLAQLGELVREVVERARVAGLHPAGLCVAVPGLVARGTTRVITAPNLGWRDIDLSGDLHDALRAVNPVTARAPASVASAPAAGWVTPLTVDNEAHLGAQAEMWTRDRHSSSEPPDGPEGTARDVPARVRTGNILHVSAEIGIGAAVLVDGELLRGARGFAGELGHVPVRQRGRLCGCGARGCLEQYAGEEAVLRAVGLDPRQAIADHPGPGARVDLLYQRAEAGDDKVLRALRIAGRDLGIALSGAVSLLDPHTVVLGGALAQVAPWLAPPVEEELTRRLPGGPSLVVSLLGADGPLLGAARSVVRAVLDDPPGTRSAARTASAAPLPA